MRVAINLATQPYEDTRRFYARWRLTLLLVGIVTALLVAYAAYTWVDARSVAYDIERLEQQQAQLDQSRKQAQDILDRPENRGVRDTSQLLNSLIARKALFSWTLVFSDLEKLMPPRVRVVSIRPDIDKQNHLVLSLSVEGESSEAANALVSRMEQSRRFRETRIVSQQNATTAAAGPATVKFEISAIYVPGAAPLAEPGSTQTGQAGGK